MKKDYNILIVDDNKTNLLLLKNVLEKEGFRVGALESGKDVINVINMEEYHLVLLDIMMPEVDGFQVLDYIKSSGSNIPVIMLSACHERKYVEKANELGADEYIKKPFIKKDLLNKVYSLLNISQEIDLQPERKITKKANSSWFEKYFGSALRGRKKKKICVVDDSITDVMLLEHALEEENYKVVSAYDGNTAVETIINEQPDLILLDILLPGINGIEVLKAIRNNPLTENIPAVMITVIHDHEYVQSAMELGIEAYVNKPYKLKMLVEIIDDIFKERHQPKKIYRSFSF